VQRDVYYGIYMLSVAALLAAWVRSQHLDPRALVLRNWRWAVGLGLVFGAVLALMVFRVEDSTARPDGIELALAVAWRGIAYGLADGLLLSVFPILVVFTAFGARRTRMRTVAVGALALVVSVGFTAAYHAGYSDFRSTKLRQPVAGDLVWSVPTLVTLSPLGSPIAHAAMHVSAVLHSYETDVFLPPHGETAVALERPDLDALLAGAVARPGEAAPGVSAAVITGEGTWTGTAGVSDLASGAPVTDEQLFRWASVTKTYTAALVLDLVADGRLSLDDTLERWVPDAHPDGARITIQQLLSHSSGIYDSLNDGVGALLGDTQAFLATIEDRELRARLLATASRFAGNPEIVFPAQLWIDIAASQPLDFAPGTRISYSNTGYMLLGRIVERATGHTFADELDARLLAPLGLDDTYYVTGPDLPQPHARGYVMPGSGNQAFFAGKERTRDATRVTLGIAAASAIVATPRDVARFYRALFSGEILPPRLLERMTTEQLGIGSAWLTCGSGYFHTGALPGWTSFAYSSGDGSTAAAVAFNGSGSDESAGATAAAELYCSAGQSGDSSIPR